jgi:helicase
MSIAVLARAEKARILILPLRGAETLFEGYLRLQETPKGPRPKKFLVSKDGDEKYLQPEDLVRLLRKAGAIYIARGDPAVEGQFVAFLEAYQLPYRKVSICQHCLSEKKKFTPLDKRAIRYKGDLICERCALEELKREADFRHLGRAAKLHMARVLLKRRNLDDVLALLSLERLDSDLTKFDEIPAMKEEDPMPVEVLDLPPDFKKLLESRTKTLLPVQAKAVQGGLLKGRNLLVVSATATGKSLVGEMAGIKNFLEGRGTLLFLVPLVALANQKYDQLSLYRELGAKTSIRVGVSRIKLGKGKRMNQDLNSEIIVGTYEGVDQVLRTGRDLGKVGTVVIDEVHMLEEAERGHRLSGLIARLRFTFPKAQFIYLSATVGNPAALAKQLGSDLIDYQVRPVAIERHLIFAEFQEKRGLLRRLVKEAASKTSSTGYKGQTIIFTNSRKNCNNLAQAIPNSAAYHAGMQYDQRRKVEALFAESKIDAVVTTAALAAGVDFPASQVIFDSLAMGIEWLSVHEFNQMLGRAGRPGYHDRGIVYLLPEPGKKYMGGKGESEDEVALRLLRGKMEDVLPEYEEEEQQEEVLANSVVARSKEDLVRLHKLTIGLDDLNSSLKALSDADLVRGIEPTWLGKAAAAHFLTPEQVLVIRKGLAEDKTPLEVAVDLEKFEDLYLKAADRISVTLRMQVSTRALHGSVMDLLSSEDLTKLDPKVREELMNFAKDFTRCGCKDTPYCGCPERKVSLKILELRADGASPNRIIQEFSDSYGIYAYTGDLINYLDTIVRHLEAIEEMARVLGKKETAKEAKRLRERIEG